MTCPDTVRLISCTATLSWTNTGAGKIIAIGLMVYMLSTFSDGWPFTHMHIYTPCGMGGMSDEFTACSQDGHAHALVSYTG